MTAMAWLRAVAVHVNRKTRGSAKAAVAAEVVVAGEAAAEAATDADTPCVIS